MNTETAHNLYYAKYIPFYNGTTVTRQISTKTAADPERPVNRIRVLKYDFAEDIVTQHCMDDSLITLETNCMTDESGQHIKHIALTILQPHVLQKLEDEIRAVAEQIQV